ncbi:peptidase C14, caspase domain-containing protein [Armillaria nabsnona]|nr:peptidase C14, caspase domain-containing protein [Armillaria nabsnona]
MISSNHGNPHLVDGSKFWAVVIGIDNYAHETQLRGCVSDAISVSRYLIENLGVEENHIQLLLSTTSESLDYTLGAAHILATRANIVDTLLGLSTNVDITKDDNILISFSGHGASYRCEDYYSERAGIIDALCPADRDPANGIPDISDRELSTILAEICRTKGHHITVILDCYHASGATGDVEAGRSMALARQAKHLDGLAARVAIEAMFTAANTRLAQLTTANGPHRYQSVKEENWQAQSKETHVLLTACDAFEVAPEDEGQGGLRHYGVFTRALLDKLEKIDQSRDPLPTYIGLIGDLPENDFDQFPWVVGDRRNQRLWYTDCCPVPRI